ncbi:DUF1904 domain-containing protein [Bdellovibrio reynosensis]|uniref:DUF1904 domain-containing protein n=1 Tax=Bdellovibrio reynosensis TaxID=2835041 RepID=A0ABY4CD68_9BACT|nr:DUF1904 family protein [Bdellovibrio reynosensis]UOF02918.1 DUF1904 domain-containing protein [Bdellovibrio reynosensis]
MAKLSSTMVKDLAAIINTSEDNFTFEVVSSQFFSEGQETASYPFVEVLWFARTQEVQNSCASYICDKVRELTKQPDVVVIFVELNKTAYYENGKHF